MIARMLRGQHEVVTAESGAEGRRILAADRAFDAIVSDLMMPDVSGIDLHAWLAAEDHALAERMVFVTGGACTPRARDYLALVDNPCLEKPFDAPALRAALAALVDAGRRAG
jgi:CheY-like chemotaxis protein